MAGIAGLTIVLILLFLAARQDLAPSTALTDEDATYHVLLRLEEAVMHWSCEHNSQPPAHTIEELDAAIVPILREWHERSAFGLRIGVSGHVLDAWGRPMRLRHVPESVALYGFIVYSVGANGIDEHGFGDDIAARGVARRTVGR